jgi:hypothetical protein
VKYLENCVAAVAQQKSDAKCTKQKAPKDPGLTLNNAYLENK